MEKRFKRELESLEKIFDFLGDFMTAHQIDNSVAFSVDLAVEELFTNMVKYNPENLNDISIAVEKNKSQLTIVLTDFAAKPFDVTKTTGVDISRPLQDRTIGGLGLHLTKKVVDKIDYEYTKGQSRITLIKLLEK